MSNAPVPAAAEGLPGFDRRQMLLGLFAVTSAAATAAVAGRGDPLFPDIRCAEPTRDLAAEFEAAWIKLNSRQQEMACRHMECIIAGLDPDDDEFSRLLREAATT